LHRKIGEIIGRTGAVVDSSSLDDGGVVEDEGKYLVVAIDGMHSRLSDFPFLAGFHATRATLRDIYCMGGFPLAIFSDVHLADDGDLSKIFDYVAGIATVSEVVKVPYVTGSTLRIGGDMVIGERMTGCVGAVGKARKIIRTEAEAGDRILLTEGSGGGTIATAAIYFGKEEVVKETINLKFIRACEILLSSNLELHAMKDVTNGGIRGDANDISYQSNVKLVLIEDRIRELVNPKVLNLLDENGIDYLGVSLDSLLVISKEEEVEKVKEMLEGEIKAEEIGWVEGGKGCELIRDGKRERLFPKFRESPYTPIKKIVGVTSRNFPQMREMVDLAAKKALEKKIETVKFLCGKSK
jgi:hydrogenase expression/formation protein